MIFIAELVVGHEDTLVVLVLALREELHVLDDSSEGHIAALDA